MRLPSSACSKACRSVATEVSVSKLPAGPARPQICKPSPNWLSLMSQTNRSMRVIASAVLDARSRPRSSSTPKACASLRMSSCNRSRRLGSSPSAFENSSSSISSLANRSGVSLWRSGGGICPRVTALIRRLACAASPGSFTIKGIDDRRVSDQRLGASILQTRRPTCPAAIRASHGHRYAQARRSESTARGNKAT